jgi:DNA-directed RNA polymerase specialized sigma24 family protein
MPAGREKVARTPGAKESQLVSSEEKIARLLGLIVVKEIEQKNEQVLLLRSVGFDVSEVASMLGMTTNHVNVATFTARKAASKKKSKK